MNRRGVTLFEIAIASTLLAVMAGIVLQAVSLTARQRRTSEAQYLALQEATNRIEQIVALPWEELDAERAQAILDEQETTSELGEGFWKAAVVDEPGEPSARRVTVVFRWPEQRAAPIGLSAWVYEVQR